MIDISEFRKKFFIDYNTNQYDELIKLLKIGLDDIFSHAGKGPTYPTTNKLLLTEIINGTEVPIETKEPSEVMNELHHSFSGCQKAGHNKMYKNVLPEANIVGLVTTLLGNLYMPNGVTGEDAGSVINAELECASAVSRLAGYNPEESAGIFTFGGTGTNLYAMKLGLLKSTPEHVKEGRIQNTVVIGSAAAHYCHEVVCTWLGIGSDNFIQVKSNEDQTTNMDELKEKFEAALKSGKRIAAIMLSGGTTSNMGIDNVKDVYDFREKMIKKYNLDYIPHIHLDSVIGWAYLCFKYYDLEKNKFEFSETTCKQISKVLEKIETIKYADSFGVDFHKTGYVNYISSMIVIKNRKDIDALKKKKEKTTPLFHDDLAYNPGVFTLETTRSSANVLGTWISFKSIGIEGYQLLLGNAMEVGNYFRGLFNNEIKNGMYIINADYYGPDIFLGCTSNLNVSYDELINNDKLVDENNKYTAEFAKWLIKERAEGDNGYTISKSSAAIYNKNGKAIIGIRIYPLSPYITEQDMKELCERMMKDKDEFDRRR